MKRAAFVVALILGGCTVDDIPGPRCSPTGDCPSGRTCQSGRCILAPSGQPTWESFPVTGPDARSDLAMAFDSARNQVVLFGGFGAGGQFLGDTWTWDSTARQWIEQCKIAPCSVNRPTARAGHAMAYDTQAGVTVLFGGFTGGYLNDLWEWNGQSWNPRSASGPIPGARRWHGLTYDSDRQRMVLNGGYNGNVMGETWEWNGAMGMWQPRCTQSSPCNPSPPALMQHGLAYHAGRRKTLLFGGYTDANIDAGESWTWDGVSWTVICSASAPCSSQPSARHDTTMGYDAARNRVVLFGGFSGQSLGDTWQWDDTWQPVTIAGPPARHFFGLAYDGVGILLFGGKNGTPPTGDTWRYGAR